jgi:hypothetical protein
VMGGGRVWPAVASGGGGVRWAAAIGSRRSPVGGDLGWWLNLVGRGGRENKEEFFCVWLLCSAAWGEREKESARLQKNHNIRGRVT